MITAKTAAKGAGISKVSIYNLIDRGLIGAKSVRYGRKFVDEVALWLHVHHQSEDLRRYLSGDLDPYRVASIRSFYGTGPGIGDDMRDRLVPLLIETDRVVVPGYVRAAIFAQAETTKTTPLGVLLAAFIEKAASK